MGWTALAFAGLTFTAGLAHADDALPAAEFTATAAAADVESPAAAAEADSAPASEAPAPAPAPATPAEDLVRDAADTADEGSTEAEPSLTVPGDEAESELEIEPGLEPAPPSDASSPEAGRGGRAGSRGA